MSAMRLGFGLTKLYKKQNKRKCQGRGLQNHIQDAFQNVPLHAGKADETRQNWAKTMHDYLSLSTSCMSNKTDCLPARNLAARSAPSAKVARLEALCVSSTRSPMPANSTVWSPTTSPPRTVAKPMVLASRSPVTPSRPYTAHSARLRPSALAAASPKRNAVPEGASTLCR